MMYLDMHCDTLMLAYQENKGDIGVFPQVSIDVARLRQAGAGAQFFAAWMPSRGNKAWWETYGVSLGREGEKTSPDDAYIDALWMILQGTLEKYPEDLAFAQTASRMREIVRQGKTAAFFSLEDGRSVEGSLEKLRKYHEKGVSLITLTWNHENCFGFPNSTDKGIMAQGLKPFGKEAVEYMNELGMVVDVSHLSDGGFWDVCDVSRKPFVASHSNCRALSPHPRNLTDEMLRALAEKGGVTGLNFCSGFLSPDIQSRDSFLKDMVAQVCHMVNVGGLECTAIGTDFDGIESRLEVKDPTQMELLFEGLRKAGFSQDAVEKIAWKNAERVLYDITG
ncbi:MAG: dipeptidase [Lachnospiraceae bacterium]|nr:dipeptidase [Lachnospiraceae bacterium]